MRASALQIPPEFEAAPKELPAQHSLKERVLLPEERRGFLLPAVPEQQSPEPQARAQGLKERSRESARPLRERESASFPHRARYRAAHPSALPRKRGQKQLRGQKHRARREPQEQHPVSTGAVHVRDAHARGAHGLHAHPTHPPLRQNEALPRRPFLHFREGRGLQRVMQPRGRAPKCVPPAVPVEVSVRWLPSWNAEPHPRGRPHGTATPTPSYVPAPACVPSGQRGCPPEHRPHRPRPPQ